MYCQNCGNQNLEGALFCSKCNNSLREAETQAVTQPLAQPLQQSSTQPVYFQQGQSVRQSGQPVYVPQGQPVRPSGQPVFVRQGQPVQPSGQPVYIQQSQPVYIQQGQPVYQQAQPVMVQPIMIQPVYQRAAPQPYQQPAVKKPLPKPSPDNPVLAVIKQSTVSPGFIATVIVFSLTAIFGVIDAISQLVMIVEAYYSGAYDIIYQAHSVLASCALLLVVAGLWVTFAGAVDRANPGIKTNGFTLIRTGIVLSIIFSTVVSVLALIQYIPSLGYIFNHGNFYLIYSFITLLAVIPMRIIYRTKVIGVLNQAKYCVETGVAQFAGFSMFVVVVSFMKAADSLILFCGMLTYYGGYGADFFYILNYILNIAAYTLFGIVILLCRNSVKNVLVHPDGGDLAK